MLCKRLHLLDGLSEDDWNKFYVFHESGKYGINSTQKMVQWNIQYHNFQIGF